TNPGRRAPAMRAASQGGGTASPPSAGSPAGRPAAAGRTVADPGHCYTPLMRTFRRCLAFAFLPIGLAIVVALLGTWPRACGEDKPGSPPAGGDPGMGDPAAMADSPKDPDDEDGDTPEALGAQVEKAIKKGVAWLKQHQLADGSWGLIEGNQV